MSVKNNTTSLQELLEKAKELPQFPILTNEGSASDLVSGKQLIGANGEIIDGTVNEMKSNATVRIISRNPIAKEINNTQDIIGVTYKISRDTLVRQGVNLGVYSEASNFGDATIEDVVNNKTFTSKNGIKITGTNPYEKAATDNEIAIQADLITQIKSTVDSLPEAGSGDSSSNIGLCTVTITEESGSYAYVMYTGISEGKTICDMIPVRNGTETINVVCGTSLTIYYNCINPVYNFSDNILPPQNYETNEYIDSLSSFFYAVDWAYVLTPFEDGSTCTIIMYDDD